MILRPLTTWGSCWEAGSFPSCTVKGLNTRREEKRVKTGKLGRGKEARSKARKQTGEGRAGWHFEFIWLLLKVLEPSKLLYQGTDGPVGTAAFHLCNLPSVGVLELTTIGYSSLYLPRSLEQGVGKAGVSAV